MNCFWIHLAHHPHTLIPSYPHTLLLSYPPTLLPSPLFRTFDYEQPIVHEPAPASIAMAFSPGMAAPELVPGVHDRTRIRRIVLLGVFESTGLGLF